VQTGPVCLVLSSSDIAADRSNHSHNDLWTKLLQCSTEATFARKTSLLARLSVHVVDWLSTQINQITIEGSKRFEKAHFPQRGKCGNERLPNSPIES
jgi:hypothetical protein